MSELKKIGTFCCIICCLFLNVSLLSHETLAESEGSDHITLHVEIDKPGVTGFLPLVYVNRELRGMVPGSFDVPVNESGAIIEIGVAQIERYPLYSFKISQDNIKSGKFKLSYKSAYYEVRRNFIFSNIIKIPENETAILSLIKTKFGYTVSLPREPYVPLVSHWLSPYWRALYLDHLEGVRFHDRFSNVILKAIRPPMGNVVASEVEWSGAEIFKAFFMPNIEKIEWVVESNPSEAIVHGLYGEEWGTTKVKNVNLPDTSKAAVFIKKSGYKRCYSKNSNQCNCTKKRINFLEGEMVDPYIHLKCELYRSDRHSAASAVVPQPAPIVRGSRGR